MAVPDVADFPASGPQGAIAVGPDGHLWFTDNARGCVGRWWTRSPERRADVGD